VIHVDDLIEPRPEQILLAALPAFPWSHPILRSRASGAGNQSFRFVGIPDFDFARKSTRTPRNPAKSSPTIREEVPANHRFVRFFTVDGLRCSQGPRPDEVVASSQMTPSE
jgi:hypothetical protein